MLANSRNTKQMLPGLSGHTLEIPLYITDYHEPSENQQEMEDYHDVLPIRIRHSDATSIGLKSILSSHPRPDTERVLDVPLLEFDLNIEIKNLKLESNWKAGRQRSKTLSKSENMSVVLMAMHKATEIKMHQANGPITLQVLEGNIQFMTWQSCVSIKAGQFITLHKNVQHNIIAKEQTIALLTIMHMNDENKPGPEEKEIEKKEIEEKDKEVVEESENINFPDFPTYPPEDDVYQEPTEPALEQEKI